TTSPTIKNWSNWRTGPEAAAGCSRPTFRCQQRSAGSVRPRKPSLFTSECAITSPVIGPREERSRSCLGGHPKRNHRLGRRLGAGPLAPRLRHRQRLHLEYRGRLRLRPAQPSRRPPRWEPPVRARETISSTLAHWCLAELLGRGTLG